MMTEDCIFSEFYTYAATYRGNVRQLIDATIYEKFSSSWLSELPRSRATWNFRPGNITKYQSERIVGDGDK